MTYVCRETRFLIAELMQVRKVKIFNNATLENFKYIPEELIKTFTSDNRKKFSGLEEKLGIKTYFANLYHLIILFILFTIYLVLFDFSLFTPYTKIPD